jgi:YbbR domain-containing protein
MMTFLRNLIFSDFWLKLFSLVLAILIWLLVSFAIHKQGPPTRTFNIPVLVTSAAADVHNLHVNPNRIDVTVRGDARKLEQLEAKDLRAFVDLTGARITNGFRRQVEITVPADIAFVGALPKDVEIVPPAVVK